MKQNGTNPFSPELETATEALAAALAAAPPLTAYQQAKARLEAEPASQALLQDLLTSQGQLRQKQMNGRITQADIDALRALQTAVQADSTIMDYVMAQQDALAYLPEVNQSISQWLGIDFAALAAGG
ncbi:MAG: YlbF family regulator [Anaerolinea sp.]|nr:YlbF family regulator [Anaerolinea sp.]